MSENTVKKAAREKNAADICFKERCKIDTGRWSKEQMRLLIAIADELQQSNDVLEWLNEKWCIELQKKMHEAGMHRSLQSFRDKVTAMLDAVVAYDRPLDSGAEARCAESKPDFYDEVKRIFTLHKSIRALSTSKYIGSPFEVAIMTGKQTGPGVLVTNEMVEDARKNSDTSPPPPSAGSAASSAATAAPGAAASALSAPADGVAGNGVPGRTSPPMADSQKSQSVVATQPQLQNTQMPPVQLPPSIPAMAPPSVQRVLGKTAADGGAHKSAKRHRVSSDEKLIQTIREGDSATSAAFTLVASSMNRLAEAKAAAVQSDTALVEIKNQLAQTSQGLQELTALLRQVLPAVVRLGNTPENA